MVDLDEWLEIGKIVAPQGLRGEMRVYPNTDFPERFLEPGERWLMRNGQRELESVTLLKGRFLEGKGLYVIQLQGITHRDQAESFRNSRLWVPVGDRPPLEEGEFHVADLIGLGVYHQDTGAYIGRVKDVLPAGNDLLEVDVLAPETPDAPESEVKPKTVLIPFVHEIVPVVDLDNQRIEIIPPPGLLEG